jgi:hypothetical protein
MKTYAKEVYFKSNSTSTKPLDGLEIRESDSNSKKPICQVFFVKTPHPFDAPFNNACGTTQRDEYLDVTYEELVIFLFHYFFMHIVDVESVPRRYSIRTLV